MDRLKADRENSKLETDRMPLSLVAPACEEELLSLVRAALEQDRGVLDSRSISSGSLLAAKSLCLDLSALGEICEHVELDLVAQAQCGIRLSRLNELLALHGQFFPVDFSDDITLGELIRLGDGGYLEAGYGYLRSNILGLDFIEAQGNMIRAGGRVVKNVTGFDVTKLLVGYPLGLPVRAFLRLYALPQSSAGCLVKGDLRQLFDLSVRLLASGLPLSALEIFRQEPGEKCDTALYFQAAGPLPMVQDVIAAASSLLGEFGLSATESGAPTSLRRFAATRLEMPASASFARLLLCSQLPMPPWRYSAATQRLLFVADCEEKLKEYFSLLKGNVQSVLEKSAVSPLEPLTLTARLCGLPLTTHYFGDGRGRSALFDRVKAALDPKGAFSRYERGLQGRW